MKFFTLRAQSFLTLNVLGTILSTTIAFTGSVFMNPVLANGPVNAKPGDPVKEIISKPDSAALANQVKLNVAPPVATYTAEELSLLTCTCDGNLVQNPSFENGSTSWSWWNGSLDVGTYAAQCGLNAAHFLEGGGSGNGGTYQDITGISVGSSISVNVFGGVHNAAFDANVAVEFYAGNTYLSGIYQQVDVILPSIGALQPVGCSTSRHDQSALRFLLRPGLGKNGHVVPHGYFLHGQHYGSAIQ